MLVNIDGDIVCYRAAAVSENESLSVACLRADDTMRRILINTQADKYNVYLSGNNVFRKQIDPQYKANRVNLPRPKHLEDVKAFLVTEWNARIEDTLEADDLLGINQTSTSILATIDKDLNQIPGSHYNFVKEEFYEVTPMEGIRFFYKQLLIGDTSDNVFGIRGIGPVKASKLIDPLATEEEMYFVCRRLYKDDERFHRNCKVLWILRNKDEVWEPSQSCLTYYDQQLQEEAAASAISDQQKMVSSESTGQEISGSTVSGTKTGVTD